MCKDHCFLSSFMDSLCRVRNEIKYVLLWQTVSALVWVLSWYLFPLLRRNLGNKHQNNPFVSTEIVRHSSTYIILYLSNLTRWRLPAVHFVFLDWQVGLIGLALLDGACTRTITLWKLNRNKWTNENNKNIKITLLEMLTVFSMYDFMTLCYRYIENENVFSNLIHKTSSQKIPIPNMLTFIIVTWLKSWDITSILSRKLSMSITHWILNNTAEILQFLEWKLAYFV